MFKKMKNSIGTTLLECIIGAIIISVTAMIGLEFIRNCRNFLIQSEIGMAQTNIARGQIDQNIWNENISNADGWNQLQINLSGIGTGESDLDVKADDPVDTKYQIITITVDE